MPSIENDYSPILRSGTLDKPSGIRGRHKLRQSIPNAGIGEELVLILSDGNPVSAMTAGERYWGSASSWVIADVSVHHLAFRFSYQDPDGLAGYDIAATARVAVINAAVAARSNVRGVREYIEPAMRAAVTRSLSRPRNAHLSNAGDQDTPTELNSRLQDHSHILHGITGQPLPTDQWLAVTVTELSIAFDGATQTHYNTLVDTSRATTTRLAGIDGDKAAAMRQIEFQKIWAEHYGKDVPAELGKYVTWVAADPTPENIRILAEMVAADGRLERDRVDSLIGKLIDSKLIVEFEDIPKAIDEIDRARRGAVTGGAGRPDGQPLGIDGARSSRSFQSASPDVTVADADIVDDGSGVDDDRDWGN